MMVRMKKLFCFLPLIAATVCSAQMAATPAQYRHLVNQKNRVLKIQEEIARLQAAQYFEISRLSQLGREVIVENRWPSSVQFDMMSLAFVEAPANTQGGVVAGPAPRGPLGEGAPPIPPPNPPAAAEKPKEEKPKP